jgi:dTDP-4-dehydrorhamnose reductase/beta-phosphoglucomutase-like phosphatase (HAD superfamily)
MKILVCGATGLLGREICNKLKKENINFIATYNNNIVNEYNYYNFNLLDKIIQNEKPTIIINCIVNRLVDECENKWNDIKKVNIDISDKLSKYFIKIIHISTDYIFDGVNPPYNDLSIPNPIQNYGISKLISELRIINNSNNYLIIRVPVLFTDKYTNLNENSITQIGKKIMDLTNLIIYEDDICIRRPIYIPIFVNFIYDSIINNYNGIYHFYNPIDKITKYKLALEIKNILNKLDVNIKPTYNIDNRPFDTELTDNKFDIFNYYNNYNFSNLLKLCFTKFYHPIDLKDCFLLIDLDGTIIDSETQHYQSYNEVIGITKEEFNIKNQYNDFNYDNDIKQSKNKLFKSKIKNIKLFDGSFEFLSYILLNNINYCIVTNTNKENIDLYKINFPILAKLTNWICREDYINKKPHPECFNLALTKYYKNEKYIIGIENTIAGYNALSNITNIIYIVINDNKELFINLDVFLINTLKLVYNNNVEK